jgi:autotransporter-associated beta strand protein
MIKSDTTTMNTAGDWSGVAPVIGEVGLFNNIISSVNAAALTLGGNVTVGGLIFTNNLNGPVTVAAGNTLTLGSAGIDMSKANQSVIFNCAVTTASNQVWNVTNNQSLTVSGAFTSASNNVIKTGGGTLYLGTATSDAGANIQVNAGTVQANVSSGIMLALNGGAFNVNVSDGNPINVLSGGTEQNVGGNRTWFGNLTGSGPLTVIASSTHTWSGNNSAYTGTITLQGSGSLRLSALTAVSASTAYIFNGGTMNANASGLFSLGSLSGSGTIGTSSGENFSIGALGGNTTFTGVIGGAGFIQKDGSGALTLTGASTYSGGTTINAGTLLVNNTIGAGTGTGSVTVNAGGTLDGNGAISGAATVNSGGTLSPGASASIGTLTFSNSLTLAAGSTNVFAIQKSPLTNDIAKVLGTLTSGGRLIVTNTGAVALAGGDSFKLFNAASYGGGFAAVMLPALGTGLAWNTNALNTNGVISVVALTPPAISGIQNSGGNLTLQGSGGTANWPYVVQMATNLTAPWIPVATNHFDAMGHFSQVLTNTYPQSYYRILVQ